MKTRWLQTHFIFIMGLPIPRKMVFILKLVLILDWKCFQWNNGMFMRGYWVVPKCKTCWSRRFFSVSGTELFWPPPYFSFILQTWRKYHFSLLSKHLVCSIKDFLTYKNTHAAHHSKNRNTKRCFQGRYANMHNGEYCPAKCPFLGLILS